MTPEHRRLLWVDFCLIPILINIVINGAIGWAATRTLLEVPLFGVVSVSMDLVGMAFGLTFGTGLVVTGQARKVLQRHGLAAPAVPRALGDAMGKWPRSTLMRSFNLGVLSVPLFAPLPLLALLLLGVDALDSASFVTLKGVLAGIQGGLVTPLVALSAWITPSATISDGPGRAE